MKPHHVKDNIDGIQERNRRVEAEKAWETSFTRRTLITIGTYVIVGVYLSLLNVSDAWLHAFIPAGAYVLSTLSLWGCKLLWLKKIYKKEAGGHEN